MPESVPTRWSRPSRLGVCLTIPIMALALLVGRGWKPATPTPPPDPFQKPPPPRVPVLKAATCTVANGIHCLGELHPAVAYVVEVPEGLVLIDSGIEPDAERLKREMAWLNLDWTRVRAVLLTHVHADHSG